MSSTRKSRSREIEVPDEIEGGFCIGEEIGRGSFATVYRGWRKNTSPPQQVAIKAVVRSKLTTKLFQNLQDEINILKRIRHGNVVSLVDCVSTEHFIYLVMQYCASGDLSMYIKRKAPTPPGEAGKNPEAVQAGPSGSGKGKATAAEERWPHPKDGGLNEWVVRSFLGQLADALHFLRSHDIIHRDIKPQNLLLHPSPPSRSSSSSSSPSSPSSSSARIAIPSTSQPIATDALTVEDDALLGTTPPPGVTYLAGSGSQNVEARRHVPEGIPILRVADFGFARVLTPQAGLAETLCGSPLYMAPEILRYEKYDAKADLWSVGAVLYEACVGKPPFRAQNHVELLRRIEKGEDRIVFPDEKPVKEGETVPHKVPDDVKALIRGLLKRNPVERMGFKEFFERAASVSSTGPLRRPAATTAQAALVNRRNASFGSNRSNSGGIDTIRPPSTTSLPTPGHSSPGRAIPKVLRPAPPVPVIPGPQQTTATGNVERGAFVVGPQRPMGPSLTRQGSKDMRAHLAAAGQQHPPTMTSSGGGGQGQGRGAPQPMRREMSAGGRAAYPGQSAPSPSNLPPPPMAINRQPSFPAKYVVSGTGGAGATTTTMSQPIPIEGIKTRDYAIARPAYPPQADPPGGVGPTVGMISIVAPLGQSEEMVREPSDDDAALGREYVVVEKRAVEINALVDDLATSPANKRMSLTRRVSRGLMQRPNIPGLGGGSPHTPSPPTAPSPTSVTGYPSISFPPRPVEVPSPPSYFGNAVANKEKDGAALQTYGSSPRSFEGMRYLGSPRSAGFPNSAFARALGLASARSFGPTSNEIARRSAPRTPGGRPSDAAEMKLVSELEDYAQKVLVIVQFADEKLARLLPPTPAVSTPAQPSPSPQTIATAVGAFAPPSAAVAMRRTPSSSSGTDAMLSSSKVEVVAAEAMTLYIKALAFLDKAIRHAAEVSAARRMQNTGSVPGAEVALAMEWLRTKFNEAFEKADFAKSKADYGRESNTTAEKLIYDRALEKSRSAAVNELRGENVGECELEYETALWMLSAILDPTMHDDDVGSEDDVETVERFIASIKSRLSALRRKLVGNRV